MSEGNDDFPRGGASRDFARGPSQEDEVSEKVPDPSVGAGRRYGAALAAILIGTAAMAFYRLDGGAEFDPTDAWVAQTAREMRERGDWIVPHFAGEPFLQKSPGPYWAVIAVACLRGTPVDVVSTRAPNAVAAVILVGVVFGLARAVAGPRAAVFAGLATASSLFILYWSHRGNAELMLTCLTSVSLACFWIGGRGSRRGWRRGALWTTAYLAAGAAMLYKMPMPVACVGVPALGYVLVRRRWDLLRSGWHLPGIAVFLAVWLPWFIAVCRRQPMALAKWRVEFLDRFTGDLPNVEANKQWFFYLLYLVPPLLFCLPSSLSLPRAVAGALRRDDRRDRDGMLFLAIWFFGLLAFFTASTGKEIRYFLPALPPLFVLLGCELADFFDPRRPPRPARDRWGAVALTTLLPVALIAGGFALHHWQRRYQYVPWESLRSAYAVTALILAAGLIAAAWLYRSRREHAAFGAIAATMAATWLWAWPRLMPLMVSQAPARDFAAQLNGLPASYRQHLRNVGFHDPRVIWWTDLRYPRVYDQLRLLEEQGGRRSLEYERRRVGEEMVRLLEKPVPVLLVAMRSDYVLFMTEARREAERLGRPMPPTYLWIQTRIGPRHHHQVVFANIPPPWPEPPLRPPSEALRRAETRPRR